jgi:hypothetical protein
MEIREFIANKNLVQNWLNKEMAFLNQHRVYASYWFHPAFEGFGVVIVDSNSGEFHLMPDGRVTKHVERGSNVVHSDTTEVADLQDLLAHFADFKSRILSSKAAE